ncbi:hypothetical protein BAY61_21890 [Prauserella marina]|uniref:Uncharacterized protein n=1 Tax=Prauserella marina TaxID=530584 RepID=A0A222VTE9_9PSEU|nr:hypothetical protein [Prauserella marina]ASR37207.1 hypothetical protein BAY61_21890 [Prauserella marina]PWV72524.1 hypothetical protein DES30_110123 [Prauserella marina]SDD77989.1 hypothetical protein SAMN05421630_112115 [Prauserella marina]
MDPNWKYFGYDINTLRRNMSGEGLPSYAGVSVTYSGYWNQGKPLDEQTAAPYLAEDAQTPAPDSDEAEALTVETVRDRIMGEQPGTASDRASQWFNIEAMLFFVQNELFNQTDALDAEWESPAAKEAYLMKVGSTLAHIEMWREAAEANHAGLSSLASAMRTAQTDMRDLWRRYQEAVSNAEERDPYADDPTRDYKAPPFEGTGFEYGVARARWKYDKEARQLASTTADSYADAISKLETARANRMVPMNAILHPEAAGMELPPMPPGGGPGGGPSAPGGSAPAPPGGSPPAPAFNGAPPPPAFGGAQPPAGSPRAPGAPAPTAPTATPRMPQTAPAASPPNAPTAGPAGVPPGAPGAVPPVAPGTVRPGAPTAQTPGAAPTPGRAPGTSPTLGAGSPGGAPSAPPGAGGLPGKAPPAGSGMPGKVMPPPAGGAPQKPKQGKVLGDKDNMPGAGRQGGAPPPASGAPPGRQSGQPGDTGRLESQDAFRPPPPPASPVLDTTNSAKKRARAKAAADAAEQDRLSPPPGATPSVLSNARVESKTPAKKQRKRPATESAVPTEFMAGVDTGTAPVFEGRLAEQKDRDDRRPLGDIPAALRGPAAATLDEHQRHGAPQADRTTRTTTPQPEPRTGDSWDVDTPGGPVVSSAKRDEYRAEPKKILGTRQH